MLKESLQRIREVANTLPDDDPDKLEMLNTEGDYSSLMEWALRKRNEHLATAESCKGLKDTYANRQKSFEGKANHMKDVVGVIIREAGESKYVGASATVSITSKPQAVQVLDESKIPEKYFKIEKKIDKAEINKAVKDGEVVEGVILDNGGESLMIRSK